MIGFHRGTSSTVKAIMSAISRIEGSGGNAYVPRERSSLMMSWWPSVTASQPFRNACNPHVWIDPAGLAPCRGFNTFVNQGLTFVTNPLVTLAQESVGVPDRLLPKLVGQDFDVDEDGVPRLHRGTRQDRRWSATLGSSRAWRAAIKSCSSGARERPRGYGYSQKAMNGTPMIVVRFVLVLTPNVIRRPFLLGVLTSVSRKTRSVLWSTLALGKAAFIARIREPIPTPRALAPPRIVMSVTFRGLLSV